MATKNPSVILRPSHGIPKDDKHWCYEAVVVVPNGRIDRRNPSAVCSDFTPIRFLASPGTSLEFARKMALAYNRTAAKKRWRTWGIVFVDLHFRNFLVKVESAGFELKDSKPGRRTGPDPSLGLHGNKRLGDDGENITFAA